MKFVFFGTPYVARDTLAMLIDVGFVPELVVTNPDAPRGRGHVLTPSETKVLAEAHGIPVFTPVQIDESVIAEIATRGCEYAICVAYGKILPKALIDAFPKGILNIHYSLLPKYRGASPVESAILHGETTTGVTIQKMVPKLDAGDIVAQAETEIGETENTTALRARLITLGAELLIRTLPEYLAGTVVLKPQDETAATYATKMKKEDGLLDLLGDTKTNWNKYRAYNEWPGTYFFIERNGKQVRVKIKEAVFTSDGRFQVVRVIPEGKKEMHFDDFMRG